MSILEQWLLQAEIYWTCWLVGGYCFGRSRELYNTHFKCPCWPREVETATAAAGCCRQGHPEQAGLCEGTAVVGTRTVMVPMRMDTAALADHTFGVECWEMAVAAGSHPSVGVGTHPCVAHTRWAAAPA